MNNTPETDAALYPMNQVDIVWPEFSRKLERERDEAREALQDMLSGWHYIRKVHGDLYGVGWDRAQAKAEKALEDEK